MEQDEWKRSRGGSEEKRSGAQDRYSDPDRRKAGGESGGTEAVPYMERFFGSLEQEPRQSDALSGLALEAETAAALSPVSADVLETEDVSEPSSQEEGIAERFDAGPEDGMDAEELNRVIEEICRSKAEEFRMLGYEQVTGREVWECVSDKYAKTGIPPLHRIVNDILSLKVTQFMNWMTMSIYKDAHFR